MIRIIKGTYGLEKGGVVRPMTKHSEPFKLSESREAELVAAGVAVYVEEPTKTKENINITNKNIFNILFITQPSILNFC